MNYQVLARKWRPQNFTEMVGQHHVLRALKHALDHNQLHHAYLFTGTRGVGKTTVARILAMCLNCETGITSTPCGVCSACKDIRDGKFVDLIEVDAASRTKVEQTRDLLENVAYAPTRGRFKIYLIDEVHMLSTHSFNALLKTLEEPPAHVKFFLATTDPDRLPMTVLSRCLHFHLKNMPAPVISAHLAELLTKEHIAFTSDALDLLAHAAQGSMRDALSLLDQAIAYGGGKITRPDIQELLGHIDPAALLHILTALQHKQADALIATLDTLAVQGADYQVVLDELIATLHQLAVLQMVPQARTSAHEMLAPFISVFTPEDVQLFYQIALNGRRDLPWVANPRLGLEMILLRMLAFYPSTAAVTQKTTSAQIATITTPSHPAPVAQAMQPTPSVVATPVVPAPVIQAEPAKAPMPAESRNTTGISWAEVMPQLGLTGLAMALASHCVIKSYQNDMLELALAPQHAPLHNSSSAARLEQALASYLGHGLKLKISLEEVQEETLAAQQNRVQQQAQQTAVENINADPQVQALMQRLGAQVLPDSISAR